MNSNPVSLALEKSGVQARALSAAEKQAVIVRLRERLGVDVLRRAPWDDDSAPDGCHRVDGWELIPKYVGTTICLVFLPGTQTLWEFKSGADVLRVLKDCPALEFYVCDEDANYLLCSNHHDFVIGWGLATPWVESLSNV